PTRRTQERRAMSDLSRRDLLKTTGAGAVAIAVALAARGRPGPAVGRRGAASSAPAVWNHDPSSPIGPPHWADIGYPTCGLGLSQSPVNIRTHRVAAVGGAPLLLNYQPSELIIENT